MMDVGAMPRRTTPRTRMNESLYEQYHKPQSNLALPDALLWTRLSVRTMDTELS